LNIKVAPPSGSIAALPAAPTPPNVPQSSDRAAGHRRGTEITPTPRVSALFDDPGAGPGARLRPRRDLSGGWIEERWASLQPARPNRTLDLQSFSARQRDREAEAQPLADVVPHERVEAQRRVGYRLDLAARQRGQDEAVSDVDIELFAAAAARRM
jgi:hypothetical protein